MKRDLVQGRYGWIGRVRYGLTPSVHCIAILFNDLYPGDHNDNNALWLHQENG
jgi:hypothetical protein